MGIDTKYYFISTRKGAGEKGVFYIVTLLVEEPGENGRSFNLEFFVGSELHNIASTLTRFQAVDAIFVPRYDGKAKLISLVGL